MSARRPWVAADAATRPRSRITANAARSLAGAVLLVAIAVLLALAPSPAAAAEVQARVSRSALAVGEATTLEIIVQGAAGGEPEFEVPAGIEVLGRSRDGSFSWINGRSSVQTVFKYEIAPVAPGQYQVGPIRVRVGGQLFECRALRLTVSAEPARVGGGQIPATLVADVSPNEPFVGQPVVLRVRLIQHGSLTGEKVTEPATPGFWSEPKSDPESYYAQQGSRRVQVTEERRRLLPLAQGPATVGPAVVRVVLPTSGPFPDPLAWLGGASRREVTIRSEPVEVTVRALPRGAPAGFDGAVGDLSLAWRVDRERTSENVPVTVWLEVRGVGNLPLLRTPVLDSKDFEVFVGTAEDSAGFPGALTDGLRRFQWTLLPRRLGRIELPAPAFVWFDPAAGAYRLADLAPIRLQVDPPVAAGGESPEGLPAVLASHPVDPGAQAVAPWAWALSGGALGAAIVLWRTSRRPPTDQAERARQREWLRVVGLSSGMAFWHAADQASAWLVERGRRVETLRREISSARYGGGAGDVESARRRLVEELSRALPPATPAWPLLVGAGALAAAAVVVAVALGPRPGDGQGRIEARAADEAARTGDIEKARRGWQSLWNRGGRGAPLAARLAWAEVRAGRVGPAAAWVLRGEREEPRDAALAWVAERVREGGGLAGATAPRWPVRRIEWAIAALLLGATAGGLWPRRAGTAAAVALTILCAAVFPLQGFYATRASQAVLDATVTLEGPDLELAAGQVVTVLRRAGEKARVVAGRDIEGWLPAAMLLYVR